LQIDYFEGTDPGLCRLEGFAGAARGQQGGEGGQDRYSHGGVPLKCQRPWYPSLAAGGSEAPLRGGGDRIVDLVDEL
jgi:hypothetical protein